MSGALPSARDGFLALAEALSLQALAGDGAADRFAPLHDWLAQARPPLPLQRLAEGFHLDPAQTAAVALLLAAAMSEPVARAVTAAAGSGGGVPLWLLARAVPGLDAASLSPAAALRRFGIVEIDAAPVPRIEARLRLADAVMDRLLGQEPAADAQVLARMLPVQADPVEGPLAEALGRGFAARGAQGLPPAVSAPEATVAALAGAVAALGLRPWRMAAADLPADPDERDRLAAVWSRDAALDGAALIVEGDGAAASIAGFADRVLGQVVLAGPVSLSPARGLHLLPPEVDAPQRAVERWAAALGPARVARLGPGLGRIARQFRLDPDGIATALARAGTAVDAAGDAAAAEAALWHAAARAHADPHLPGVRMVEPAYHWGDIVLSTPVEAALHRIETHVRHSAQVFDDWGFAARMGGRGSWRGRGVAALFSGPPGTGKTMAAEILAAALDLRVLSIDLSQIISKWIGETSKNVAAAFDAAERSGAVMVWNEGDAIWGARGGVNSATDRHVNAEVGDLLQRIEDFSGFTVVTTNLRHAIDPAFLRRFRFTVDFPPPAADERLRLWARAFPAETPVEPLNWAALANLPLTGGAIRNVALGAAFQAAEAGGRVTREMLVAELASEMKKHDLPVPRIDWGSVA